jgi:hypothetical protein
MEIAIQVVWWIGLAGALVATLVILKEVALLLHTLRNIHELAEVTREAAWEIAKNIEPAPQLSLLGEPAGRLDEVTGEIASLVASIEETLRSLPAGARRTKI